MHVLQNKHGTKRELGKFFIPNHIKYRFYKNELEQN